MTAEPLDELTALAAALDPVTAGIDPAMALYSVLADVHERLVQTLQEHRALIAGEAPLPASADRDDRLRLLDAQLIAAQSTLRLILDDEPPQAA